MGGTLTDPVADTARAAAERLATEGDAGLPAEVAAVLSRRAAGQFTDVASVATLVVAAADVALAVYRNLRDLEDRPPAVLVAYGTRSVLRERFGDLPDGYERVAEAVAREVTRAFDPRGEIV
jgi:hypothetical protein